MPKWQWRSFSNNSKNWKNGIRGEWYKPAPLRKTIPKIWVNPYAIAKPKQIKFGWSFPMKDQRDWRFSDAHRAAINRRNAKQNFYKRTNTRPKYVIVTKK